MLPRKFKIHTLTKYYRYLTSSSTNPLNSNSNDTENQEKYRLSAENQIKNVDITYPVSPRNESLYSKSLASVTKTIPAEKLYPYSKPGSVLSSFLNDSHILQELLKLGVNFYKLEKNLDAIPLILSLSLENVIAYVEFLTNLGLPTAKIGEIFTKNPFILKEDLNNLQVRIQYLQYKKFKDDMILRILESNPKWLTTNCQEIDERLGFYQQTFNLSSTEVRSLATINPRLITYDIEKVKLNLFVMKEEMGFTDIEMKSLVMKKSKLLTMGRDRITQTFDYLHNVMKIPLERIAETPQILTCRRNRLQQRHMFLEKMGKDQYDPKKANYISLTTLVSCSDSEFSTELAKSSVQTFNAFLKSL